MTTTHTGNTTLLPEPNTPARLAQVLAAARARATWTWSDKDQMFRRKDTDLRVSRGGMSALLQLHGRPKATADDLAATQRVFMLPVELLPEAAND